MPGVSWSEASGLPCSLGSHSSSDGSPLAPVPSLLSSLPSWELNCHLLQALSFQTTSPSRLTHTLYSRTSGGKTLWWLALVFPAFFFIPAWRVF